MQEDINTATAADAKAAIMLLQKILPILFKAEPEEMLKALARANEEAEVLKSLPVNALMNPRIKAIREHQVLLQRAFDQSQ